MGKDLQAEHGGKSRIAIRLENDVLAVFKARAEMTGGNYQTLVNKALHDADCNRSKTAMPIIITERKKHFSRTGVRVSIPACNRIAQE